MRTLKTTVTMIAAEGRARYEREILTSTGGPTGTFERGVGPGGEAAVTVVLLS